MWLYQASLNRTKEANGVSITVSSKVVVITLAELPFAPYKPEIFMKLTSTPLFRLIGSNLPAFRGGMFRQLPFLLCPRPLDIRQPLRFNLCEGNY